MKEDQLKTINEEIELNDHFSNYLNRANIYRDLHLFDDAISDCNIALKQIEEEHFLSKDYYKFLERVYKLRSDIRMTKNRLYDDKFTPEIDEIKLVIDDTILEIESINKNEEMLDRNRDKLYRSYFQLSKLYYKISDFELALTYLLKSFEIKKSESSYRERSMLLANIYFKLEKFENVNSVCHELISNDTNWDFLEFAGDLYFKMGNYSDALNCYQRILSIESRMIYGYPDEDGFKIKNDRKSFSLVKQGLIHEKLGNIESAFQLYKNAYDENDRIVLEFKEVFQNKAFKEFIFSNRNK